MMDLDNIPDTQTEAEELEEVVTGAYHQLRTSAQPGVCRTETGEAGRFCRSKSHDGSVTDGIE
ncbi:hypothetical protein VEE63_07720 [Escherichia coli]|nr:hypothetical protein VEE63_07720 [Escherichia coli]